MKKALALLLAAMMLVATLTACGGGGETQSPAAPSEPTGSAPAETDGGDAIDAMTFKFSSTYQEAETGGQILQFFIDKVSELSGGAITVDMSWGGTLFDAMGELDAVMDNAVQMIALGHMPHLNTLNYLSFPSFAPGGTQAALDYFNTLMFDDPETSALIQGEAESYGIKYLNVIAGGANALCTSFAFTDLDSMVKGSSSFGNFMAAQWESLGFQVTALTPPEIYDAFNRGMIDATQMGLAPMVSMSWYEVAPYWALDGTYTAGNMFTVNLDWWNSLTPAQQNCIQAAADETEAYSATIYDDAIASDIATVEDATGNKFVEFSAADLERLWASCFVPTADSALKTTEASGKTEGMTTILEKAAEITGYDWQH